MAGMPEVAVPAGAVAQLLAELRRLRERAIAQWDDALCRHGRGRRGGLLCPNRFGLRSLSATRATPHQDHHCDTELHS
jgi:glyoxylase-like metal-dependent hydrolase (beta-lactamase superfamily II)